MQNADFTPDFPTETISEGRAKVVVPKLKAYRNMPCDYAPSKAPVFYNPVMELNRDLAVLALRAYQRLTNRKLRVCEPLTACGLRGIRFAAEVEGIENVVVSDINEKAFKTAQHNVALNGLNDKVEVRKEEANYLLSGYSAPQRRFDFVDIDPFGSPAPFIDSAVRALRDGGLLAVTATDMAPLCGIHPQACIRKYGGKPLRTEYCHELAARLVAGSLSTSAAKHDMAITPVFSHQSEHYVRVYATTKYGAKNADQSLKNMGYVLHCFKCLHRETVIGTTSKRLPNECVECGSTLSVGGPMWAGKLFDHEFVTAMKHEAQIHPLRLSGNLMKMLATAEYEADAPSTYYVVDKVSDAMNLPVPSVKNVIASLRKDGEMAVQTIFHTRGLRSAASAEKIRETIAALAR